MMDIGRIMYSLAGGFNLDKRPPLINVTQTSQEIHWIAAKGKIAKKKFKHRNSKRRK